MFYITNLAILFIQTIKVLSVKIIMVNNESVNEGITSDLVSSYFLIMSLRSSFQQYHLDINLNTILTPLQRQHYICIVIV